MIPGAARFVVSVDRLPGGWRVDVSGWENGWHLPPRTLRASSTGSLAFPLPPEDEVALLAENDLCHQLCAAGSAGAVQAVLANVTTRQPEANDVNALAGYLFAVLLGGTTWNAICEQVGTRDVELALRWAPDEHELNRLPWEMMTGPQGFLAADPRRHVAITRVVAGTTADVQQQLPGPLRVLFVVGADLSSASLRPGAEYLGLLRRLRVKEMTFNSRLLLRATSQDVEDEIVRFRPSVVHFICHGRFEGGEPVLELASEGQGTTTFSAQRLHRLLTTSANLQAPAIVVLSACNTGTAPARQEIMRPVPMAVQLVEAGIPIVVGMAGRVADRACRLFTRRFYEALLQGEPIVAAAAQGRRAGLLHLADPTRSVDWAFPTITMGEGGPPAVTIDAQGASEWMRLERIALSYHTIRNPPVFCDRLDVVEGAYRQLMDASDQARVLAVQVADRDQGITDARYGKTRLLEELAAQSVRDGHVPCMVAKEEPPATLLAVALAILMGSIDARERFGYDTTPESEVLTLAEAALGQGPEIPGSLDPAVAYRYRLDALYRRHQSLVESSGFVPGTAVVARALHHDLIALVEEARRTHAGARVLVLVDEVHRFDAAVREFLGMLGPDGLVRPHDPGDPIRVVFAYSTGVGDGRTSMSVHALRDFVEEKGTVSHFILGPFPSPREDWLPYQQFLLNYTTPWVISRDADQDMEEAVFDLLHKAIGGIPSQLKCPSHDVDLVVYALKRVKCLEPADDEAALQAMQLS